MPKLSKDQSGEIGQGFGGKVEPGPGVRKTGWVCTRGRRPGSRLAVCMWGCWTLDHISWQVCVLRGGFMSSWTKPSHGKARLMVAETLEALAHFEFLPVPDSCVALFKHSLCKDSQQPQGVTDEGNESRRK